MDERDNEKESNKEFDEFETDPTKEAFFSDMGDIEEDIASEAIELVRHALSLIESRFYDDSIEILRQAIGLYAQINKLAEVNALNSKISEIYLLKEKTFRERELETDKEIEAAQGVAILEHGDGEESYKDADSLIIKAIELVNNKQFDAALDVYDDAIIILKSLRRSPDVEKVNELIEDCYNRKADFLRKQKILTSEGTTTSQQEPKGEMSELELKAQKIRAFEDAKRKENEKSNQAYELIGKATELKNVRQYDEALKLLEASISLFEEINWINEVKKIKSMFKQVEIEKERFLLELQRTKAREQQELETKTQLEAQLIERASSEELIKQQAQAEKLREQAEKKQGETKFQNEISEMVDYAEKLVREYDLSMKKGIKKGKLVEECIYPKVIKIYEEVKQKVNEKGWKAQIGIYNNQISHYHTLFEKDKKLRQIESQKLQKQKDMDEIQIIKKDTLVTNVNEDRLTQLKEQRKREAEIELFRENIENSVKRAEKMAREYDSYFKKAVKAGNLKFDSKYPEIIKIFTEARDSVLEKGWKEDAIIYSGHIKKYSELFDKEKRVREIETKKDEEKRIYDNFQKVQREDFDAEKVKQLEAQKIKEYDEKNFQEEVDNLVNKAERMARDYEVALKKALKKGKLIEESPYLEVIEIYTNIRKKILEKGWAEQGLIYTNQIKIYQEKLEKDKKLREIEYKKAVKQVEFEIAQKGLKIEEAVGADVDKLKKLEELTKHDTEEERLEREIDEIVDKAEKKVREYELAIKKKQFDKECPYLEIVEIYKKIREKVYARGWKDESEIYGNQVKLYQERFEKDKRLRELEAEKIRKQVEFEESLKTIKKTKPLRYQEIGALDSKDKETEEITKQAMNLIDEAENKVRSYELSLKKDILIYESPYEQAILNYENAQKLFQKIGWKEEAHRLKGTINFYKDKKIKDENLRVLEQQKLEASKQKIKIEPKEEVFVHERRIIDFEKLRVAKSKESEEILNRINRAERLAQEYEIKKKDGILNIESPFEEIINIYKKAKLEFKRIGWTEQANQLENSLNHYQDKSNADKRLRTLEAQKSAKQEGQIKKRKIEAKLAKEAEEELLRLKIQALEVKRKSAMEYESKKKQAFNFMDLAKKELKQNNFEKAVSYYKESEKIFAEINWLEGTKMIKESINVIKLKKERIEREAKLIEAKKVEKLKLTAQIEEQISKAKDLHDLQQDQRRREILAIQEEKEREREISEKAYGFLEEGTKLKERRKFEEAYEKYIIARDMFKKIGWEHEVSRINNDLLFILKKEMKQTEKLKAYQKKKVEEKRELEELLKDADEKQKELDKIRKEEKFKQREKLIQKERDLANDIIKTLRYNEGILALRKVIKKIENTNLDILIKELNKQIEVLENASQVPIITKVDLDRDENLDKFKLAYQALDKAQISLSSNSFMRAITELNEAIFNLKETKIGIRFISTIEDKINTYKKELDIKKTPEPKVKASKVESSDIREKITARRAERRRKIKKLMGDDDDDDDNID